jgi:hypothetical protein
MQDFVDPVVLIANAEISGLDAQGLAHREKRVEHQFLRHDAEEAPRPGIFGSLFGRKS